MTHQPDTADLAMVAYRWLAAFNDREPATEPNATDLAGLVEAILAQAVLEKDAEIERLREALQRVADSAGPNMERGTSGDGQCRCIEIARTALKES